MVQEDIKNKDAYTTVAVINALMDAADTITGAVTNRYEISEDGARVVLVEEREYGHELKQPIVLCSKDVLYITKNNNEVEAEPYEIEVALGNLQSYGLIEYEVIPLARNKTSYNDMLKSTLYMTQEEAMLIKATISKIKRRRAYRVFIFGDYASKLEKYRKVQLKELREPSHACLDFCIEQTHDDEMSEKSHVFIMVNGTEKYLIGRAYSKKTKILKRANGNPKQKTYVDDFKWTKTSTVWNFINSICPKHPELIKPFITCGRDNSNNNKPYVILKPHLTAEDLVNEGLTVETFIAQIKTVFELYE